MSEIRDFLTSMTVPQLQNPNFAGQFDAFCRAIKDNFNKIISAPFLKGDRGSNTHMIHEPLMKEDNGRMVWTEFAKTLMRAIYNDGDADMPLPLQDGINDNTADRLVGLKWSNTVPPKLDEEVFDDDRQDDMDNIDGGVVEVTVLVEPGTDQETEETLYYHSYDLFKTLENIPVCYDELTREKMFWVPFYFFDGRLNYIQHLEANLSRFRDMSCVVWGKAHMNIANPTKEDLEDPDNWQWEMIKSDALPKLYYNPELDQFCWEVAGEQTNIIAQGLKGDKGEDAHAWVCIGDTPSNDQIMINGIISPNEASVSDMESGDLAMVLYPTTQPSDATTVINPYYGVQFGIVHITGEDRYIEDYENAEILQQLRNYSLHDYLSGIGDETNEHYPAESPVISAL